MYKRQIIPASNLVWPGSGVYLTAIGGLERRVHFGLTNVGTKPTFDDGAFAVETHILDFDGDVYGRDVYKRQRWSCLAKRRSRQ